MAKAAKNVTKNFEQSLQRLEEVVATLENGSVSLDESLKLFEEGVKMVRHCAKVLEEAERKVSVLMKDGGDQFQLKDFVAGDE